MTHPFASYRWDQQAIGDTVLRYLSPIMCDCVAARIEAERRKPEGVPCEAREPDGRPNVAGNGTVLS